MNQLKGESEVPMQAKVPCRVFGDIHGQLRDLLLIFARGQVAHRRLVQPRAVARVPGLPRNTPELSHQGTALKRSEKCSTSGKRPETARTGPPKCFASQSAPTSERASFRTPKPLAVRRDFARAWE